MEITSKYDNLPSMSQSGVDFENILGTFLKDLGMRILQFQSISTRERQSPSPLMDLMYDDSPQKCQLLREAFIKKGSFNLGTFHKGFRANPCFGALFVHHSFGTLGRKGGRLT